MELCTTLAVALVRTAAVCVLVTTGMAAVVPVLSLALCGDPTVSPPLIVNAGHVVHLRGDDDEELAELAAGEAPGRWGGSAAGPELGLAGGVTEDQMHRVFGLLSHPGEDRPLGAAPRQYRSVDERLVAARGAHDAQVALAWARREVELTEAGASEGRIAAEHAAARAAEREGWAEREAVIRRGGERGAVAGLDLTFSPPKSVSVLWAAAGDEGREVIWAAHHEGVAAAMAYIEREAAWSRTGYNGVRQVDTTGLVVAAFDHRMSRAGDVAIHTHSAVLNRVRCGDGGWRAIDARAVYRWRPRRGRSMPKLRGV